MDQCQECGFAYDLADAESAGAGIVAGAGRFAAILRDATPDLRRRPDPDTWSPVEYSCHVRDVLLVQRERVLTARRTDRPTFEPMGRDERVEHDGYAQQDPDDVARQLTDAAALLANVFARLDAEDWDRRVEYGYPAQLERSLRWVGVHTLHEVRHHLRDVGRQLAPDAGSA